MIEDKQQRQEERERIDWERQFTMSQGLDMIED